MPRHLMSSSHRASFVVAALLCLMCSTASAQTVSGTIAGTVSDPTGAIVPGAKVAVTNEQTNVRYETMTNQFGEYKVPFLPVGAYTVRAEATGFQVLVREGIILRVGETVRVDLSMPVGSVQEQVTITGAAPLLSTENASTGQVIENERIVGLPLNGRNFLELTQLTADVNAGAHGTFNRIGFISLAQKGVSFSAQGQRDKDSAFLLDGTNVRSGYIGSITIVPSIDTIQEFKLQTTGYSAQYGTSPVQLNVATKSGTNTVHGSLFNFFRNTHLNARDAFAVDKLPYHQNQFGGTIGGPVRLPKLYNGKDSTFFFFGWEVRRRPVKEAATPSMPPQEFRDGDFSSLLPDTVVRDPFTGEPFSGNIIPSGQLSPGSVALLEKLPLPTRPGLSRNYDGYSPANSDVEDYMARVDQRIGRNDNLYVRYGLTNPKLLGEVPGAGGNPLQVGQSSQRGQNVLGSETHTFSPTVFNEFRFAYNRSTYLIGPVGAKDWGPILNWGGLEHTIGAPLAVTGFALIRDQAPGGYTQQIYQISNNLFAYRGKHSLSMGVDFQRKMTDPTLPLGFEKAPPTVWAVFSGQYSGYQFADYLLGVPSIGVMFLKDTGYLSPPMAVRYPDINLYFQDDWKVTPRLTLNLGLRYELVPVLSSEGEMRNFDFNTGALYPEPDTAGVKFFQGAHKNFAPRVGFAYRLTNKTVIRGGYGLFYSRTVDMGPTSLADNPPASQIAWAFNTPETPTITVDNFFNNSNPEVSAGAYNAILNDYTTTPSTQSWSFDIQRELSNNLLVDAGYKGSLSTHLDGYVDLNTALPGEGPVNPRRPYPDVGPIPTHMSVFTATHHSGLARVQKRLSGGFSLLGSYAWAKTLDQTYGVASDGGEDGAVGSPQDRNNLRAEKGRSGMDIRHRAVFSYSYELPFGPGKTLLSSSRGVAARLVEGWTITGITTFSSGSPVTIRTVDDVSNTGASQQRPDVLFDPQLPRGERSASRWFKPEAFVNPPVPRFGNAGRGLIPNPGLNNFDLSVLKNTRIWESLQVQFRAEFFNAWNHTQLGTPSFQLGDSDFGSIGSARSPRIIQFALKLVF